MIEEIDVKDLARSEYFYSLPHETVMRGNTFQFYELGPVGVGHNNRLLMPLDEYIDKSQFPYIDEEIQEGIIRYRRYWTSMIPKGIVPWEINGEPSLDSYMVHRKTLEEYAFEIRHIPTLVEIREHLYKRIGLSKGWSATLQLRYTSNFKNKTLATSWKDFSVVFPKLKEFISSLPIKILGYVNIMMYDSNRALPIHRDTFLTPHSEHFININFHTKPKPTFIYNEITGEKKFLKEGTQCYFFNECDLHGVEETPEPYYTVRIDCKFEDSFAERLGMLNGLVFDWRYPNYNPKALLHKVQEKELCL